jgi:hypothetical protein
MISLKLKFGWYGFFRVINYAGEIRESQRPAVDEL